MLDSPTAGELERLEAGFVLGGGGGGFWFLDRQFRETGPEKVR